jgi:hypothetical protein
MEITLMIEVKQTDGHVLPRITCGTMEEAVIRVPTFPAASWVGNMDYAVEPVNLHTT